MKIEATRWVKDFLVNLFKQIIEFSIRIILFFLPMGLYLFLLQFRKNVSSTSNLSVFTTPNSVWQHIFPGFILVAIDPNYFKNQIMIRYNGFQNWINSNKYILCFLFALLLVILMFVIGSK